MNKSIAVIAGEPNSISSEIIFKSWKLRKKYILKPFFVMPSLFLIYLITLPLWLLIHEIFWIPLYIYLFFNLISSLGIAVRRNIISFPLVFFLYFVVHLSYGIGMIVGFIDILRK